MTSVLDLSSAWMWLALLVFLLGFPVFAGLFIGRLPRIAPLFQGDHRSWRAFWGTTVVLQWGVTIVVAASLLLSGKGLSTVGLISPSRNAALLGAVVVALFALIAARNSPSAEVPPSSDPEWAILPHTRAERLAWLLGVCPTAGFCEELVYRGFFLSLLRTLIGLRAGLLLQALVFGFHHGGHRQGAKMFLMRAAVGLVFGLIVVWRGNLLAVMGIHYCVDAAFALKPAHVAPAKA